MQRSVRIVAALVAVLMVGGCQKPDVTAGRMMQYPGVSQYAKMQPRSIPEAAAPKILPQTHFAAGMMFEEQGNVGKAITQYRKAVALNHKYVAAYHHLGRMYSISGQHERAIKAMTRAVEIKPDNAILHNDLSFEYMFAGRWNDAERSLRRAIKLRPTMARAYINLALALSKQGRFNEALTTFRKVLPEADAYYNLGLLYRGNKEYASAADAFRHVLAINKDFAVAQTQLDEMMAKLNVASPSESQPVGAFFAQSPGDIARQTTSHAILDLRDDPDSMPVFQETSKSAVVTPVLTPPAKASLMEEAVPNSDHTSTVSKRSSNLVDDLVRSILPSSAGAAHREPMPKNHVERVEPFLAETEQLDEQKERARQTLIKTIDDAIKAQVASSRRAAPVVEAEDDVVAAIGGGETCDPFDLFVPRFTRGAPFYDQIEIEQDSFVTDEEFVEDDQEEVKLADAPMADPSEDYRTDEEFVEETSPRVEWDQQIVTLDELVEIMDNERRCFEESEFADVAPDWPIIDSLAYSPVEYDSQLYESQRNWWADYLRSQDELDARAKEVTAMLDASKSHDTKSRLSALEKSVVSVARQVARRKATARRHAEARRRAEANAVEAAQSTLQRNRGVTRGDVLQGGGSSRSGTSARALRMRKDHDVVLGPTVFSSPYGPPAIEASDRDIGAVKRADRTAREARQARVQTVRRGVEMDWRKRFRKLNVIASIVSNDIVCIHDEGKERRRGSLVELDGQTDGLAATGRERDTVTTFPASLQQMNYHGVEPHK